MCFDVLYDVKNILRISSNSNIGTGDCTEWKDQQLVGNRLSFRRLQLLKRFGSMIECIDMVPFLKTIECFVVVVSFSWWVILIDLL